MIQRTSPHPAHTHTPKTLKQSQEWDHTFGKSYFSIWKPIPIDHSRAFPTELGNLVQKGDAPNQYEVLPRQFWMSLLWYIWGYWLYWSLTPVSHDNKFLFICFNVYGKGVDRDAYLINFGLFSKICGSDWLKYNITLYLFLPPKHSIIIFQSIDCFLHSKILITNVVGYKNALFRYLKVNIFFWFTFKT